MSEDASIEYVCARCRHSGVRQIIPATDCRIQMQGHKAFMRFIPVCRRHPNFEMERRPLGSTDEARKQAGLSWASA